MDQIGIDMANEKDHWIFGTWNVQSLNNKYEELIVEWKTYYTNRNKEIKQSNW